MGYAARAGDVARHDYGHCHAAIHPAYPPTPMPHPPQPFPVINGCPTVNIGGAPAARVGDVVAPCALAGCVPSGVPGTIARGSTNVNIGGKPAARIGDMVSFPGCVGPIPCVTGKVSSPGCPSVVIGG